MRMQITGADVLFNEITELYEVIYNNQKVFESKFRDTCIMLALSRERLDVEQKTIQSNVFYLTARVG